MLLQNKLPDVISSIVLITYKEVICKTEKRVPW